MRLEIVPRTLRFRAPVRTAFGPLAERALLEVTITGPDGVVGRGEAAPLEPYDGVALADVRGVLERYATVLREVDDGPGGELLERCRAEADLPQALAAVDLALWDRAGRREGRPVAALLAGAPASAVAVNATVAAEDRAGVASACAAAAAAGFACVKVKVGVGDDAGRVAAARAALGPGPALRLDANGAWEVEDAVRTLAALSPAGLELVEEPVHGVERLRAVRERVAVRVAMDETAGQPGALASGAADAVCLKLSRCGGISGLLAAAVLVRTTGAEPYVASTFDGPLGIAAAVHAAAALAPLPACGLATLELFADAPARALTVHGGVISVPSGAGLL
jgi:L-alanine-DL-glutamate epimerase-like enolase superfamily enzyme